MIEYRLEATTTRWGLALACAGCVWIVLAGSPAGAEEPSAGDRRRAVELFQQSKTAYRAGRFEESAGLLEEAYDLSGEPILLYNLARALEGKGDLPGARGAYLHYLEEAGQVPDRPAIERRIQTLERQIAEREALERRRRDAERERREALSRLDTPAPRPRSRPVLPWVVMGAGAAAAVTGGVFGKLAVDRHQAAIDEPVHLRADRLRQDAEGFARTANVLLVAGGVLVASGVTWAIVTWPEKPKAGGRPHPVSSPGVRAGPGWIGVEVRFP